MPLFHVFPPPPSFNAFSASFAVVFKCFLVLALCACCLQLVEADTLFEPVVNTSALTLIRNAEDAESWLGYSCSSIGDFNGDGFNDFVLGAPGADSGIGRAYVLYGNGTGINPGFDVSVLEDRPNAGLVLAGTTGGTYSYHIGYAVAAAGDVNGDSLMDVIVAAYGSSETVVGAAHVVYGTNTSTAYAASYLDLGAGVSGGLDGSDGFTLVGIWTENGPYAEALDPTRLLGSQYRGNPVSSAGDVNGDGFDDVIVGSPAAGTSSQGYSHVVFGGENLPANVDMETDMNGTYGIVFKGATTDRAGYAVSGGFDVNSDGYSDIIIGAPNGGLIGEFNGEAYIVFGQENLGESDAEVMLDTDLDGTNGFRVTGPSIDAYAGGAVAGAGDVNGDGVDDIVIGAFGAEPNGRFRAGGAYVIYGHSESDFLESYSLSSTGVVDGVTAVAIPGLGAEDVLGISVGAAGDINCDGVDDLWVSAPAADSEDTGAAGSIYVIFGNSTENGGTPWAAAVDLETLDGDIGFIVPGLVSGGHFGWDVAGKGVDLNDDGCSDLVMGAFLAPGTVYVLFGDADEPYDRLNAITAAIVTGVLACLFLIGFEMKACVERRDKKEADRIAKLPPAEHSDNQEPERRKSQESYRNINQGCRVVEPKN